MRLACNNYLSMDANLKTEDAIAVARRMVLSVGASYLVTALLTLPLLVVFCVLPLRPLKGWLVASQYVHQAREGRIDNQADS